MLKVYLEIEVKDRNGKLIRRRRQKSHSFLTQFIAMLRGIMFHTYNMDNHWNTQVVDTAGVARGYPNSGNVLRISGIPLNAPSGTDSYGLVVGTGTASNTTSTYALQNKIAHGTGAGQLLYGSHTFEPVTVSGSTVYFRIIRVFTNNSGASITVNEVGLYTMTSNQATSTGIHCIARDLISGGITVPDGGTLTLRYLIQLTVA